MKYYNATTYVIVGPNKISTTLVNQRFFEMVVMILLLKNKNDWGTRFYKCDVGELVRVCKILI